MSQVPAARVGKRQVRPNLSRTDFGYTERPRAPIQKPPKKPKPAAEDGDEAERPARMDKDSRSLVRAAPHAEVATWTARVGGRGVGRYRAASGLRQLELVQPELRREGPRAWRQRDSPERAPTSHHAAQTVDFTKLDMATLKRYKKHYRLKTRQNVTKTELALAVAKHFASTHVDEAETIQLFMYSARSSTLQYDRRDYLVNGNGR
tara:strand:+ start:1012 stop:1629 length:618 start_codon:yes stop_codon:yes gene_type:complete